MYPEKGDLCVLDFSKLFGTPCICTRFVQDFTAIDAQMQKWYFSPSKCLHIGFLASIRNQRLKINPCAKFQFNWTKDKGTRILTWNDTTNGLMKSYLPPSDDVNKCLWHVRDFVTEYHHAKFGCNWTTNKGETVEGHNVPPPPPAYMVPKDPSLYGSKRPQPE